MNKFFTPSVLTLVLTLAAPLARADIIPPARRSTWTPGVTVGVSGGIPNRTTIFANVKNAPWNAQGNGIADDTAAIQGAISACPPTQVVYMPAGRYKIAGSLIMREGVVLRGAGMTNTTMVLYGQVSIGGSSFPRVVYSWTGGYTKGTSTITMGSTAGLGVGSEVMLDQLNDPNYVNPTGNEGYYSAAGRTGTDPWQGGTRAAGQVCVITSISGNSVGINPPLVNDYTPSLTPEVAFFGNYMRLVGFEDFTLDAQNSLADWALNFTFARDCWVKGVEGYKPKRALTLFRYTTRCEVRDCYVHDVRVVGSTAYGLEMMLSTAAWWENNRFNAMVAPMMMGTVCSGCVVSYNYVTNILGGGWLYGSIYTHAVHNQMHLFEGNVVPSVNLDFIHGSGSHNTLFRNSLPGWEVGKDGSTFPLMAQAWNRYVNVVGNILGTDGYHQTYEETALNIGAANYRSIYVLGLFSTPLVTAGGDPTTVTTIYRHGNYDYATHTLKWDPANPDHTIPASLLYPSKPSWWGSVAPWPPIGPDLSPTVSKIPAQIAWEGGSTPPPPVNSGTVQLLSSQVIVSETAGNATLTFTRSSGTDGAASLAYRTVDGTAFGNAVTNGSFEIGNLSGWSTSGNVALRPGEGGFVPVDGTNMVYFNTGQSSPNGVIQQTFTTVPGQLYSLSFYAGVLAYNFNQQSLRATVVGSTLLSSNVVTVTGDNTGTAKWTPFSYTFTADAATATITFTDVSLVTDNLDLLLDYVRVTPGLDYTYSTGTVNWANGDGANKTALVPIVNRSQSASRFFSVQAYGVSGATLGPLTNTTVVINGSVAPPAAAVVQVTTTSTNTAFRAGQTVPIVIEVNTPVTVTGTPVLALNTGTNAIYTSGSGGTNLLFTYTVAAGQNTQSLDYTSTGAFTGGTITGLDRTLPAPGTGGSLSFNDQLVIDTTAPVATIGVPSISITATTAASWPLTYTDLNLVSTFPSTNNITLIKTGTANATAIRVEEVSGHVYSVTLDGISGTGTLSFNLAAGTAVDSAGNLAGSAGPSQIVAVDQNYAKKTLRVRRAGVDVMIAR